MFSLDRLDSGLQLAVCHLPWARGVAVELLVETGSRNESPGQEGSAHFVEHLLFKGTAKRPQPLDLTAGIEALGGTVNAFTTQETTAIELGGPRHTLPELIDAALDMATAPRFDPAEFEKEREVILEELAGYLDDPAELCADLLPRALWGQHPLGHPVAGTPESVAALKLDELTAFHGRGYRADHAVLAVAGAVTPAEVRALVDQTQTRWSTATPQPPSPAFVLAAAGAPTALGQRRAELKQRHVALGWHGPSALDPRRHAARLAAAALAETMSSRLFQRLREELGLVYQVSADLAALRDTGAVQLYLEADCAKMTQALELVDQELLGISAHGFTAVETQRTTGFLLGQLELCFDSPARLAHWAAESARLHQRPPQPQQLITSYQALTPADLAEEVSRWLATGTARAEVGPRKG